MPQYEQNFQQLSEHYKQTANAHLEQVYGSEPHRQYHSHVVDSDIRRGVGIKLGVNSHDPRAAWAHLQYRSERSSTTAELHIINPANTYLGLSALVDTIRLVPGDVIELGRKKYPELDTLTSRRHATIEMSRTYGEAGQDGISATIIDQGSSNGTGVVTYPEKSDHNRYDRYWQHRNQSAGEQDEPKFRKQERAEPDPTRAEDVAFIAFINRHRDNMNILNEVDLNVCYMAIKDLKNRYKNPADKKQLEREFNRVFHPDRPNSQNEARSHAMYVLIKKELGL
jgi:pSer/pThr/pTyr-binding forkhead associated (FHA) protein